MKSTFLLFFAGLFAMASGSSHEDSIIIVGAGSSGYAAATRLLENGYNNVQIFEAENRIGGRTYTKIIDGIALDMGAQWIHGQIGNVVFELASKMNLTKKSVVRPEEFVFVQTNGEFVNTEIGQQQLGFFHTLLESEELEASFEKMGDFISEKYREFVAAASPFEESTEEEFTKEFLNYFSAYIGTYVAVEDWNLLNGVGYSTSVDAEGDLATSWTSGGFATMFKILKKELPIDEKIHLNRKVKTIKWDADKVTVADVNGVTYEADKVIVTIPLGALKETSTTLFEPALPAKKQLAIENIGFGTLYKIYIKFETKWWPQDTIHLLWRSEDIESLTASNKWMSTIVAFASVDNAPNVLSIWYYGNKDQALVENMTDEVLQQAVMELFRKVFKDKFVIPDPLWMERTNWHAEENFRGTYSYIGVAATTNNVTNADLREPLINANRDTKVLFAGEATHSTYYGTVHGAVESGWAAADSIINELKTNE